MAVFRVKEYSSRILHEQWLEFELKQDYTFATKAELDAFAKAMGEEYGGHAEHSAGIRLDIDEHEPPKFWTVEDALADVKAGWEAYCNSDSGSEEEPAPKPEPEPEPGKALKG